MRLRETSWLSLGRAFGGWRNLDLFSFAHLLSGLILVLLVGCRGLSFLVLQLESASRASLVGAKVLTVVEGEVVATLRHLVLKAALVGQLNRVL